jgi:hypothetical protein
VSHAAHADEYYVPASPSRSQVAKAIDESGLPLALEETVAADVAESEPNNTSGQATPITVDSVTNTITASISPIGDLDYFSFTLAQRSGVFFDIDSREIGLSATLNSELTVFAADGVTQVGSNADGDDFETFPLNDTSGTSRSPDSALYLDLAAGSYFVRVSAASSTTGAYLLKVRADSSYTSTVPVFNSLPGAADTLFLDFDGHSASDSWGTYTIAPYDWSGNAAEWTPGERAAIENVWRVVSEDYSPFNINVSTSYAGSFNNGVAHRQVIGNSGGAEVGFGGALGVAFINSYTGGSSSNNTAFTFANSFSSYVGSGGNSGQIGAKAVEMGNTSSHEFGHALNLRHYGGTNPQTNGIMHTPDFGLSRERWKTGLTHSGETPVITQDDVAVISNATNTFGYRADDHGNTRPTATAMSSGGGVLTSSGIIGQTSDVDFFSFTTSGLTTLSVSMLEHVANLDAELYLYDSAGTLLASNDPGASIFASLSQSLSSGTYYAEVRSDAGAGEIGLYTLTVTTALPAWVAAGSAATWNPVSKVLTVTGATTIVADPGADVPIINASGAAAVLTINPTSALRVNAAQLNLSGGAAATITSLGAARTASNHRVLVVNSISIDSSSKLNLTDNDLVVNYTGASPLPAVEADVRTGYNVTGNWLGNGITSSTAAADADFTVAVADNAALSAPFGTAQGGPLFAGVNVDLTSVLVKFTHRADLNLDGLVDPNDAAIFGTHYSENDPAFWALGDLDYDGLFTPNDASIFGTFYDESLPPV